MVTYQVDGGRATITIDEPDRRNPLSAETMAALLARLLLAASDEEVRVIVLTGAGEQAFSAGGDLITGFVDDPVGLHAGRGALADLFRIMARSGKPTVARVNGHALAGGFGLAVACDIVVCVEDAKLGVPEIGVGLWPMIISAVLLRAMPRKAVLEMMMTGRLIDPNEAQRLGAVSRVVARDQLDDVVDEVVSSLMAKSPATLMMGKDIFSAVADRGLDADLDLLQAGLTTISLTKDAAEGTASFAEKREPKWVGG